MWNLLSTIWFKYVIMSDFKDASFSGIYSSFNSEAWKRCCKATVYFVRANRVQPWTINHSSVPLRKITHMHTHSENFLLKKKSDH